MERRNGLHVVNDTPDRSCGECAVCCWLVEVRGENLIKPAHALCPHVKQQQPGCCTIFGSTQRPMTCATFHCAWMRGLGGADDRPDRIGAMFSINEMNGGKFVFAIETRPAAVTTTARAMVVAAARITRLPVIIIDHDSNPPDDVGDRVAVTNQIKHRARSMLGRAICHLDDDVELYELIT